MARTTIEDCLDEHTGHFDLAYKIAPRAREIARSGESTVTAFGDKPLVVALREIAHIKLEGGSTAAAPAAADPAAEVAAAVANAPAPAK